MSFSGCVHSSSTSTGTAADILPLLKSVRGMSLLDGATPPLGMRGHYIDTKPGHRRMTAVGSNQNKAITKRLASAGHYQQVLCLTLTQPHVTADVANQNYNRCTLFVPMEGYMRVMR